MIQCLHRNYLVMRLTNEMSETVPVLFRLIPTINVFSQTTDNFTIKVFPKDTASSQRTTHDHVQTHRGLASRYRSVHY